MHLTKGKYTSGTSLIQAHNKNIIKFLKSLHQDYKSNSLNIPDFVNTKELQKEFLRAFYDDEGCVALRIFKKTNEIKRNITLSSNSLILLEEIKKILQENFDIKSNRIHKYTKIINLKIFINYTLSITGKSNFEKFRKEIGFAHPQKRDKLNLMIESYIRLASTT